MGEEEVGQIMKRGRVKLRRRSEEICNKEKEREEDTEEEEVLNEDKENKEWGQKEVVEEDDEEKRGR